MLLMLARTTGAHAPQWSFVGQGGCQGRPKVYLYQHMLSVSLSPSRSSMINSMNHPCGFRKGGDAQTNACVVGWSGVLDVDILVKIDGYLSGWDDFEDVRFLQGVLEVDSGSNW